MVDLHYETSKKWHPSFPHGSIIDQQGEEIREEVSGFYPAITSLQGSERVKFEEVETENGFRAINVALVSYEE